MTCPIHGPKWVLVDRSMIGENAAGMRVKLHPGQCMECFRINNGSRVGKTRLQPRDQPLRSDYDAGYTVTRKPDGTFTAAAMEQFIRRLAKDEVRVGELLVAGRRPSGVSKERFGVAVRSASHIPMLNADRDSIAKGLDFNFTADKVHQRRVAKEGIIARLVIKPSTLHNAKYGRNSAWWGERVWVVYTLKYGRGYVVQTDIGDDSRLFKSVGELRSAIKKSGWEIVR